MIRDGNAICKECGETLIGNVSEVAHILPKSYFKSIQTEDSNIIYLCSHYSKNNCHAKYDYSSNDVLKEMKIFEYTSKKFQELQELITEKINYKHYDRWLH